MMNDEDPVRALEENAEAIRAERPGDVERVSTRIRAVAMSDGNDELDDQLADLKDHLAAGAANRVDDDAAEAEIEKVSQRFTDAISNATLETRVAALMTVMDADDIGK
jgi:hypothetical protein